jgi:hypothetical protein
VSTAVLIALTVASIRYARPWAEMPQERPLLVRAYRSLHGMSDQVQEGFRPDFAGLVEFIDPHDLSTFWHLDYHALHPRRDHVDHGDFTGRTASVIEVAGCLGIWFESVRIRRRHVQVNDWSSYSFKWSLLDEPALVAALRSEPTGDLLRPRWELSGWILLDLFGLVSVGVWCRSMGNVAQRLLRRSRPSHCCPSCGYDLAGLAAPACPECGANTAPKA